MRNFAICLGLMLVGCVSTQTVVNKMGQKYIGTNFDDFVLKHGAPYRNFTLSTGEVVQIWSSGVTKVAMPGTATTSYYGNTATTSITPGGDAEMYCEVQFKVDKENIIRQVTILKDTLGSWTTSMCHEIFDNS